MDPLPLIKASRVEGPCTKVRKPQPFLYNLWLNKVIGNEDVIRRLEISKE